jgi:hypothetical protein
MAPSKEVAVVGSKEMVTIDPDQVCDYFFPFFQPQNLAKIAN